ncbi:MAG TPA: sensor histidine kinase [Arenimonas sp.]|nr:sensor histidine kinase [Arenimonas sp.]
MREQLKQLFTPLNLAGYITWAAIGWELVYGGSSVPGWLGQAPPTWLLGGLHLVWFGLFATVLSLQDHESPRLRVLVIAQYLLVFALMSMARNSSLPILLILCAVQAAHAWSPRGATIVIVLANIGLYAMYDGVWDMRSALPATLMVGSFQVFAASAAWFGISAERARDALAVANADLLATRSLLAETARDGERLRLSRELHDVAGHKLTALKLNMAALARDPRVTGDAQVQLCSRLADELLADIRDVVQQMRHSDGMDLGPALESLATPFPRPRMHLQIDGDARVGSVAHAEALLRAVQEGLTNSARHSQANNLWVVLRREADGLHLDIRDDGRGRGTLEPGNGLRGMRERLAAVGGGLELGRTNTGGVHLQAWLPVSA